jgi:hypothetical protein
MQLRHDLMQHRTLLAILFSLLALSSCGSQPERAATQPAKPVAAKEAAADALLVQALSRRSADPGSPQGLQSAKQAAERAPDRKDIAWLHMQFCQQVSGCNAAELATRLRKLDPDNGNAWLGALSRAQQQNDTLAQDKILDQLSRSRHFNIYWNTLVAKTAVAMSSEIPPSTDPKQPAQPLTQSMNQAVNWVSAVAVESFQPLAETCDAVRTMNGSVAQRCAQIAAALQRSDTYIAEGIGLGIAQRLTTAGTPSAQKVNTRIDTTRYQRDATAQIMEVQLEREKFTRELLNLMASLPREQDVFIAVMRWAGEPLEPNAMATK